MALPALRIPPPSLSSSATDTDTASSSRDSAAEGRANQSRMTPGRAGPSVGKEVYAPDALTS
jgi:hypothetical protein